MCKDVPQMSSCPTRHSNWRATCTRTKTFFFFFQSALSCIATHLNRKKQPNNQSSFFLIFLHQIIFPCCSCTIIFLSLVLYHPLLHEIDAGLHLNKSLLFCQTFIAECNALTTRRLQFLSHCSVSVQLDAWTMCRLIMWYALIWYLFLICR